MTLGSPRFRKLNTSFSCLNCGAEVPPSASTCRDHCPHCLWGLHVDVNPGDRASGCGGLLRPMECHQHGKKGWMIRYRCSRCAAERTNRFLEHDALGPDSFEALLALSRGRTPGRRP